MKGIVVLLAVILLINGCNKLSITGYAIKEQIPEEENLKPVVYFCPRDNCSQHLTELINNAEDSVYCAFFDLNLKDVINALSSKSHEINVRAVIDNTNNRGQIDGEGIRFDNDNQLSHNKFCVIDDSIVWTGSFNPTENDNNKNNNNAIAIYSSYLAKNYGEEFWELWNGSFGNGNKARYPKVFINGKKIENYFCPEDDCKKHVIDALGNAKSSVYFMAFSFTDEEIADSLLFLDNVDIKGVFEKLQAGSEYSQYKRLKGFGLEVKLDNNRKNMHHKVFIVDNKTVVTGSFNPTGGGSYKNDENIVIIHDEDVAKKYLEEFEYVWNYEG